MKYLLIIPVVLAILSGSLMGCEPSSEEVEGGEEVPRSAQARTTSVKNDVLLEATSPFEDLTEFAEENNENGITRAYSEILEQAEDVREVLTASERQELDSLLAALDEARNAGKNLDVALLSLEAYRTLVSSLEDEALIVPKAVSLLDYAGFKLHTLAGVDEPEWALMEGLVEDASDLWSSIEGQIDETGLRDAMNTTIGGLNDAVAAHDALMIEFAASVDLDLVDLLEGYFETKASVP